MVAKEIMISTILKHMNNDNDGCFSSCCRVCLFFLLDIYLAWVSAAVKCFVSGIRFKFSNDLIGSLNKFQ